MSTQDEMAHQVHTRRWRIGSKPDEGSTTGPRRVQEGSTYNATGPERLAHCKIHEVQVLYGPEGARLRYEQRTAEWSKSELERSRYKNPKATINIRSERSYSVNDDTEESGRNECRRKSTYIEADDQRESQ